MSVRLRLPRVMLAIVGAVAAWAVALVAVHEPSKPIRHRAATTPTARPTPSPARWVEVSLGDSVPAGSACGCAPFPAVYAEQVAARTGATVQVHNLGTPGQTSGGLVAALRQPSWASVVAGADIVTVTIGANDFGFATYQQGRCANLSCYAAGLRTLRANLDDTISAIAALRAGRPTAVRLTGYWDIWRDGRVARQQGATYTKVGRRLTARVNAVVAAVAAQHHVTFVDLVTAFRGSDGDSDDTALLAPDGDHPNTAGHDVIAQALMSSGLRPLVAH